jgi:hypothetical protein
MHFDTVCILIHCKTMNVNKIKTIYNLELGEYLWLLLGIMFHDVYPL